MENTGKIGPNSFEIYLCMILFKSFSSPVFTEMAFKKTIETSHHFQLYFSNMI